MLESRISEIVQTLWPDAGPVIFYPCIDLDYGDVASEVLLDLSKIKKIAPDVLGEQFLAKIPSELKGQVSVEHGFLNLKIDASLIERNSFYPPVTLVAECHISVVGAPDSSKPTLLRLLCGALLQARLAAKMGQNVSFHTPKGETKITHPDQVFGVCETILAAYPQLSYFDRYDSAKECCLQQGGAIWMSPTVIRKNALSGALRELVDTNVRLVIPDPTWCFDIEPPNFSTRPKADEFLYYVCSDILGEEIDWSVPFLHERLNTRAFLRITLERLARFSFSSDSPSEPAVSGTLRNLAVRAHLLKAVQARVAQTGFVWGYLSFVNALLQGVHLIGNDPMTRFRMENGALSPFECELLSGLGEVLELI